MIKFTQAILDDIKTERERQYADELWGLDLDNVVKSIVGFCDLTTNSLVSPADKRRYMLKAAERAVAVCESFDRKGRSH